jgi:PPP family 3-phenylpropionic acid transporter
MTPSIFMLFTIYAVVNAYFPVFFRGMGYTVTQVGFLLAILEIAGLILPVILAPFIDKTQSHGLFFLLFAIILVVFPIPLFSNHGFSFTAICIACYAVGFKGAVPVSDSMASSALKGRQDLYGRVRVAGSIGFVIMNLIMQRFILPDITKGSIILWTSIPALLLLITILSIPGVLHKTEFIKKTPTNIILRPNDTIQKLKVSSKIARFSSFSGFKPSFWFGIGFIFLMMFGQVSFTRFLSIYVDEELHSNAFGFLWALSAAAEVPFMFFSGKFIKKFGSMKLLLFCAFGTAIRSLLYVIIPGLLGAVAGQLLNSITYGLMHPAAVAFAVSNAPDKEHLVVSQTLYSVVSVGIASVLGNAVGGIIVDTYGFTALFVSFSILPLIGIVTYILFGRKLK